MKKIKLIFSVIAVSVMMFANVFCAHGLDYCDSLTYIVSGNNAVITGFKGSPEVISLPSQIDGLPVTEIRENAFYKCTSLKKIIIPESVSEIGDYAFFECTSLETAEINGNISKLPEGIFYGCEALKNVNITANPDSVADYAFYGCRSITGFTLPMSVTDIGAYSFADCSGLSDITLNSRLQNIGQYSFYNCDNLEKINLPDSLLSIGQYSVGFSEKGIRDNITITGISDSIAEQYAKSNGIRFRNRVYYKNNSIIKESTAAGFFVWLTSAVIYALLMAVLLTEIKKIKKCDCPN